MKKIGMMIIVLVGLSMVANAQWVYVNGVLVRDVGPIHYQPNLPNRNPTESKGISLSRGGNKGISLSKGGNKKLTLTTTKTRNGKRK